MHLPVDPPRRDPADVDARTRRRAVLARAFDVLDRLPEPDDGVVARVLAHAEAIRRGLLTPEIGAPAYGKPDAASDTVRTDGNDTAG